mmetsp:Transcript_127490/g.220485  ORF Transcript_127490/g.220485 Transcript_127490/m.220485 type:complete len:97 (+) Transcript_127490:611-901(+)
MAASYPHNEINQELEDWSTTNGPQGAGPKVDPMDATPIEGYMHSIQEKIQEKTSTSSRPNRTPLQHAAYGLSYLKFPPTKSADPCHACGSPGMSPT